MNQSRCVQPISSFSRDKWCKRKPAYTRPPGAELPTPVLGPLPPAGAKAPPRESMVRLRATLVQAEKRFPVSQQPTEASGLPGQQPRAAITWLRVPICSRDEKVEEMPTRPGAPYLPHPAMAPQPAKTSSPAGPTGGTSFFHEPRAPSSSATEHPLRPLTVTHM